MEQSVEVSIIIINYNTWNLLGPCIESIREHCAGVAYEIIVVDNASSDGSVDKIRATYPDVKLIANDQNLGFGRANNQALELATGRYLFLLNSDTLVRSRDIGKVLAYMDQENVAILGPRLVGQDGKCQRTYSVVFGPTTPLRRLFGLTFRLPGRGGRETDFLESPTRVGFLVGAALFINKKAVEQYGLFDEAFFFTGEEADLCLRYNKQGLKVVYYPYFEILHYVSGGDVHKCFHVLHYLKSLKIFIRKHAPRYCLMLRALMFLYVTKNIVALLARYIIFRKIYYNKAAKRYWLMLQWMLNIKTEAQILKSDCCK